MTKKLKKILLLATSITMLFCIAMFTACDLGENCAHVYGEWKIEREATCTEKGRKTHTCSKCNKVDAEEIPEKHKGLLYCSTCNKTVVDDAFLSAFDNSFGKLKKNSGIEIAVNDFEYILEYGSPSSFYYKWEKYSLNNLKGFIGLNDSGELFAYGNISMALSELSEDDKTKIITSDAALQFVVKGNLLYYYATSSAENYESFDIMDVAEYICDSADADYVDADWDFIVETLSNIISKLPTFAETEKKDLTNKTIEAIKTLINEIKVKTLSNFVDLSEEDGKYILTKKDTVFSSIINDVENLTALKFIEKYFGTGVSNFISEMPNSLYKKVSVLLDELADNNGITIDGIVSFLDECAKIYSDDKNATFKSITKIDIAEAVNKNKDKTLVDIVYELITEGHNDDKEEGVVIDKQVIGNQISGTILSLGFKTIPQLIPGGNIDFTETKESCTLLDENVSFKYVFAKDGETCGKFSIEVKPYKLFKEQNIKFNEKDLLNGYISFGEEPDASGANVDVDALVKKVSDKIEKSEEYKKILCSAATFDGVAVKCEEVDDRDSSDSSTYMKNADGSVMYIKNSWSERYYKKIDEDCYNVYNKKTDGSWEMYSQDYEPYFTFDDFYQYIYYADYITYDETAGVYYCGSQSFTIEKGKLVKMERYGDTYTFFYDDIEITLPTIVSQKFSSEEEWNEAMSFEGIAAKCITPTEHNTTLIFVKNREDTILYEHELSSDGEMYFSLENGGCYTYSVDSNGKWVKHEVSDTSIKMEMDYFEFLDKFKYSDFNYSDEKGVYEWEDGNIKVSITFANNRVVKISATREFNGETMSADVDYVYDNIYLTLPIVEDSEETA